MHSCKFNHSKNIANILGRPSSLSPLQLVIVHFHYVASAAKTSRANDAALQAKPAAPRVCRLYVAFSTERAGMNTGPSSLCVSANETQQRAHTAVWRVKQIRSVIRHRLHVKKARPDLKKRKLFSKLQKTTSDCSTAATGVKVQK